jgi:hypothetical protein
MEAMLKADERLDDIDVWQVAVREPLSGYVKLANWFWW